MSDIDFAIRLVDHGMLGVDQFVDLLRLQAAMQPPLGSVAIRTGMLTIRQVAQVLDAQADEPGRRFGEIAVGAGLLTCQQRDELLRLQRWMRPRLPQLMIQCGIFDARQIELLGGFQAVDREPPTEPPQAPPPTPKFSRFRASQGHSRR